MPLFKNAACLRWGPLAQLAASIHLVTPATKPVVRLQRAFGVVDNEPRVAAEQALHRRCPILPTAAWPAPLVNHPAAAVQVKRVCVEITVVSQSSRLIKHSNNE
jgi:hypothetical protein